MQDVDNIIPKISAGTRDIERADRHYYMETSETLIGTKKKELLDTETGEKILVDQITKRVYGTKRFWKVYLMDFLTVLGIIDSKQLDVFIYIAENTDKANNVFLGTYSKISESLGVSRPTIAKLMKKLQDKGFIKRIQNGAWLVNPNILMQGNDNKRQILLSYYEADEPIEKMTYQRVNRDPISHEEPSTMLIDEKESANERTESTD